MTAPEPQEKTLPPPWDRIFSLASKTFVWGLLIAVLYILRPFLLLIFLTFVFAYIQAHGVDGLQHRITNRPVRVIIVGLVVLGTLFATGFTLVPQVSDQATKFSKNRDKLIDDADAQLDKFFKQYPSVYEGLIKHQKNLAEPPSMGVKGNDGKSLDQVPPPDVGANNDPAAEFKALRARLDALEEKLQQPYVKPAVSAPLQPEALHIVRDVVASFTKSITENPLEIVQSGLGYASSFLLSLLFSFLIVLDLSRLRRSVEGLSKTKIGFIYDEVADNIAGFGRVLGRALEAQLFIAICNTIFTAIGVWLMGLENILVLSAIVFFCSFIPVAGTFLSSTPICLLALQAGGVGQMTLAIGLILVIHTIETYVLNPQIYGHHMRMNPVLVLIVLTIAGKLVGVWGLVLGIPIMNYVFRHAIRRPEERPVES
jgi:predicted PurR-regulated permease PerM